MVGGFAMSDPSDKAIGRQYRKRKTKRAIFELLGNYRYSMPGLNGLDEKLEAHITKHLNGRAGFFIEAGANDGFAQSNTYYYARRHKWRGLLIEPIPELADHCRKIRPESTVVCCALGPMQADGSTITLHRAGLMSTVDGALGDQSRQEEHIERAVGLQPGIATGAIEVPVRMLSSIIDEHRPNEPIDLLSLDIEGFEAPALEGLDLTRHRPRFICIEANDPDAVSAILDEHYDLREQLTHHDRLYEAKHPIA